MARSIENTSASLEPLATHEDATLLESVSNEARDIAAKLTKLYNDIALQAFGP